MTEGRCWWRWSRCRCSVMLWSFRACTTNSATITDKQGHLSAFFPLSLVLCGMHNNLVYNNRQTGSSVCLLLLSLVLCDMQTTSATITDKQGHLSASFLLSLVICGMHNNLGYNNRQTGLSVCLFFILFGPLGRAQQHLLIFYNTVLIITFWTGDNIYAFLV
jgi:hypothetical protein